MDINTNKVLELKKHVGAIHSSNKLTLVQRKIANALLYNAYNNLLTHDKHSISIGYLCNLIGYDSKDFKSIKKALVALISTVVQWNLIDENKKDANGTWNASSIIADASINGSACTYSYSHNMKELLYHPDYYGRLNMHVQAKFKSTYGLALYENCIRYQNIKQTPWFNLSTFRLLMGVKENQYTIFRDFKRRVIDKAMQEVNDYAPISIALRFKKENRAVVALQFSIKYKEKLKLTNLENRDGDSFTKVCVRLREDFGFSYKQIKKVTKAYEEKYILEKINIVENSASFKLGKIDNLAGYLELAIKKDYQPPKTSKEETYRCQKQKEQEGRKQALLNKQAEEYRRFQNKEILKNYWHDAQKKQRKTIEKKFEGYIKDNVYYSMYIKEGISNVLVADAFCSFIRNHNPEMLGKIISFEGFSEQKNFST